MADDDKDFEIEGSFDDEAGEDFGSDLMDDEVVDEAPEADEPEGEEPAAEDDAEDDAEAEGEQDADAEESPEGEEEVAAEREPMVPKSRMDSFRLRLREAEARLAEIEKAKQEAAPDKPEPVDFDAQLSELSKKFAQASLDGDVDAMAETNASMLRLQREQFQSLVAEVQNKAVSVSRDSMVVDTLVDELVASHERLNPQSDKFDAALVTRMNDMREYYETAKGFTESEALVKTVEMLMPEAFEPPAPPPPAKKVTDFKKKAEAANRQMAKTSKVGDDAPAYGRGAELDINKLTLKDLDQVSDAEWDHLLGNTL